MALTVKGIKREFIFTKDGQDLTLDDPGENLPPDEVQSFYAAIYPELTSGRIEGPTIKRGKSVYKFVTHFGTKG